MCKNQCECIPQMFLAIFVAALIIALLVGGVQLVMPYTLAEAIAEQLMPRTSADYDRIRLQIQEYLLATNMQSVLFSVLPYMMLAAIAMLSYIMSRKRKRSQDGF